MSPNPTFAYILVTGLRSISDLAEMLLPQTIKRVRWNLDSTDLIYLWNSFEVVLVYPYDPMEIKHKWSGNSPAGKQYIYIISIKFRSHSVTKATIVCKM